MFWAEAWSKFLPHPLPCPLDTWTSSCPWCWLLKSFLRPMIPAKTKANLETMRAFPAKRAKAPRANGTKVPPKRRGRRRRAPSFFFLPRDSSVRSEEVGSFTCKSNLINTLSKLAINQ